MTMQTEQVTFSTEPNGVQSVLPGEQAQPDRLAVAAFAEAMQDAVADGAVKTEMPKAEDADGVPVSGDVLTAAGVAPQAVPEVQPAEVAPAAADTGAVDRVSAVRNVSPTEIVLAAAEAVADAILVTPGLINGEGQVRVQLKPDVLEGTEVQVKVSGRKLEVEFLPPIAAADVADLIQRALPQLEQHLAARIHSYSILARVGGRKKTDPVSAA